MNSVSVTNCNFVKKMNIISIINIALLQNESGSYKLMFSLKTVTISWRNILQLIVSCFFYVFYVIEEAWIVTHKFVRVN